MTRSPGVAGEEGPEPEEAVTPQPDASAPAGGEHDPSGPPDAGDPNAELQGQVPSDTTGPVIGHADGEHTGEEPAADATSASAPPEHHGTEVSPATGERTAELAPEEAVTSDLLVVEEVEPVENAELPNAQVPDGGAVDAGAPEAEAVEPELPDAAVAAATDAAAADTAAEEEEASNVVDEAVVNDPLVDGSVLDAIVPAAKLMAAPAWHPRTVRTTKGIRRIVAVAVVAVVAFGIAIVNLGDDARRGCVAAAPQDPAYEVGVVGQVQVNRTDYDLAVTRSGAPVTGAKVCISVAMGTMRGMVASSNAKETAPGTYRIRVVLPMSGSWQGSILVTERGKPPVSVPLTFNVG